MASQPPKKKGCYDDDYDARKNAKVKTPRKSSDISQKWLEYILSRYEAKNNAGATVQVTAFQVSPAAKPGENFSSEVVKVAVKGRVSGGLNSPDSTTTYHLVMKILTGSAFEMAADKYFNGPLRELLIYSDVIPELNDFQAKLSGDKYKINIPEFVYGLCIENDYILVMQDLSPAGYKMEDKVIGLDLPHVLMATGRLARLHAVSYVAGHNNNFLDKYPAFNVDYLAKMSKVIAVFSMAFYDTIVEAAGYNREKYEHIVIKMASSRSSFIERVMDVTTGIGDSKFSCLAHGDFWTNNMMFLNDEASETEAFPKEFMMIDWGVTLPRNPLLDLQYFIHSSTTLALRRSHLEEVLRHYHTTFTTTATDLGTPPHWDFDNFMEEWNKRRCYGLLVGTMVNMITLSNEAKHYKRGKLSSNQATANAQGWFARAMMPLMMKMSTSPALAEKLTKAMMKPIMPMVKEFISAKNETQYNRILDLATEAYENGVFDG